MYNNEHGFFYKAKQTVYKWWCVVYRPVYKLFHDGHWPAEKDPYYQPPKEKSASNEHTKTDSKLKENENHKNKPEPVSKVVQSDPDAISRADEIMSRLKAEAAADEAKKQAEIDKAKAIAAEDARLKAILNSTKVDISSYIEEGKALGEESKAREKERMDSILKSTRVDISSYIEEGMAHRTNN